MKTIRCMLGIAAVLLGSVQSSGAQPTASGADTFDDSGRAFTVPAPPETAEEESVRKGTGVVDPVPPDDEPPDDT